MRIITLPDINGFTPDWVVPKNIKCFTTYRYREKKNGTRLSFNFSKKENDELASNLRLIQESFSLIDSFYQINQIHSNEIINISSDGVNAEKDADGIISYSPKLVCSVLTADCIPVLCCSKKGDMVASLHCGWKGLASGIIERFIRDIAMDAKDITFWLGPSICNACYEVKDDFITLLEHKNIDIHSFVKNKDGKIYMDLKQLCIEQIMSYGALDVATSNLCTFCNNDKFFSHRKEKTAERFISMIWIDS
jgi:hypothetical protein